MVSRTQWTDPTAVPASSGTVGLFGDDTSPPLSRLKKKKKKNEEQDYLADILAKRNLGGSWRATAHLTGAMLPNTNINLGNLTVFCFMTYTVLFGVMFKLRKREVKEKRYKVSWNN